MQRYGELKFLYLRKIGKKAVESFEDLRRKVLRYMPHEYKNDIVRLSNGSFIILGGFKSESEIDSYLGLEYDGAIIEDATTLSKTKRIAIGGSIRTSRTDDWRPRLYESANPGGVGHAAFNADYYEPWRQKRQTDSRFIHTVMGDNVFINKEYEAYLNSLTGFLRRCWRDGDFSVAAGQYFTAFNPDTHVVEPFPLPRAWHFSAALDYGWQHPTACYIAAMTGDGVVYIVGEHVANRLPVELQARAIKEMLAAIPTQDGHPITLSHLRSFVAGSDVFAESRKDGGTIARDYAAEGIRLAMAKTGRVMGAQEIMRRLGNPAHKIEPTLKIFNTCPRLIARLPEMIHDPKRTEDVLKVDADENGENGDDEIDTVRYLLMELARPRGWAVGMAA
jgi:hypothetical protein